MSRSAIHFETELEAATHVAQATCCCCCWLVSSLCCFAFNHASHRGLPQGLASANTTRLARLLSHLASRTGGLAGASRLSRRLNKQTAEQTNRTAQTIRSSLLQQARRVVLELNELLYH